MSSQTPSVPVTSLREEVICTTCLSLPRVPMFQCENGHLICQDCKGKCSNVCPTCKMALGKIRSILADKILSLMPLPCCHDGCLEELPKNAIAEHEAVCKFRSVSCVDIACSAIVPFCKMLDHMAKDHESGDFVHANGNRYKSYFIVNEDDFSREIMWISDHLTLEKKHFFRECCRSGDGIWHVWIYLLGTAEEAAKFKATIKIFTPSSGDELCFSGRINPLSSSVRENPEKLSSLSFPDCMAKRFWHEKKIHYEVVITRKKAPEQSKKVSSTTEVNDGVSTQEDSTPDKQSDEAQLADSSEDHQTMENDSGNVKSEETTVSQGSQNKAKSEKKPKRSKSSSSTSSTDNKANNNIRVTSC